MIASFLNLLKKTILLVILLSSLNQFCFGQDLYDKLARKMCKCLENQDDLSQDAFSVCLEGVLTEYLSEILEFHGLSSFAEFDAAEFAMKLNGKLVKRCDFVIERYMKSIEQYQPKFVPDPNPQCADIHVGDYFYVLVNPETEIPDTTYVTFTDNEYYERMNNGKTYSRLSLTWVSDCRFKLNFIESNDPFKKNLSKPGDVYQYDIRKVTEHSFVAQIKYDGPESFIEFERMK